MKPVLELDFSILDKNTPATTSINSKTTVAQNAPQTPPADLQVIQQLKIDISQEIKAGTDPYPLLLKAIQAIATVTNDRAYYTIHRDVMQGMGMLEQIPPEWERDSVNTRLQKLEASRRNIDAAISAHKQFLNGEPIEYDTDSEYVQRIEKCFAAAYRFIDEHKHARTYDDFVSISRDLGKVGGATPDPLLKSLLVAAFEELEREFIESENPQKK